MIPDLRRDFNARYSPEKYSRLLESLEQSVGMPARFRHNQTPVFLPQSLVTSMTDAGRDLLRQVIGNPEYRAASDQVIPAKYYVPNEASCPLFVQADFGIVRTGHGLEPRLVEIQGFPSLYAYQPLLAESYRSAYQLGRDLSHFLSVLSIDSYWAILRAAILGEHDAKNVVLMEVFPEEQKTRCDFVMTGKATGIRTVCLTQIRRDGNKLFYDREGVSTPIHRIYNRTIVDELDRLNVAAPFDWNADLEVEWAGHPNWYFRLSKFTIPFLDHPTVPKTIFLDRAKSIPDDLDNWVLKPLFSFAGLGVSVGPTRQQIDAIADPANWILQQRMRWEPVIDTPSGPTNIEVRIMYVWFEGGEPIPVNTIIRTGRGKMMGVDHNKNLDWVGASAAFIA